MPRKPRIHYEGALYHVICRGNNREWIFKTEEEKRTYMELVKDYKERYCFKLYAWVLMSNHAHLLIEVSSTSLSKSMQGIQQGYTQWYNRSHRHTGHVFEQRYKAALCNKDTYLLSLIRYIHQNPQRAKIDDGLDYPWSSHQDYINSQRTSLTDKAFPLSLFSENPEKAVTNYLEYMGKQEEVIGTLAPSALEEGTQDDEPSHKAGLMYKGSLERIIETVAALYVIDESELVGRGRRIIVSRARRVLIGFCFQHTDITQIQLAHVLNITESAVSKATIRAGEVSEEIAEVCDKLSIQA